MNFSNEPNDLFFHTETSDSVCTKVPEQHNSERRLLLLSILNFFILPTNIMTRRGRR